MSKKKEQRQAARVARERKQARRVFLGIVAALLVLTFILIGIGVAFS